jgi:hypothetical protein
MVNKGCSSCEKKIVNKSTFYSTGTTSLNNSGDIFIDQVPCLINLLSAGDEFISQLLLPNKNIKIKPSFFQLPYIYSLINNVNNNNYTVTSSYNCNIITSIYNILYKEEVNEKIATFVTYYNIQKKILTYEIPREFSYNSSEQASIYVNLNDNNNLKFNLLIPSSFYTLNKDYLNSIMSFDTNNIYYSIENKLYPPDEFLVRYSAYERVSNIHN